MVKIVTGDVLEILGRSSDVEWVERIEEGGDVEREENTDLSLVRQRVHQEEEEVGSRESLE